MLIVPSEDGGCTAIGQASHAWLSGQLARAWGNERFGAVEPWEEVCLAAEQHDVGWAEWDLAPALDPETGHPHTFMSLPLDEKLALWSRAARKVLTQSRYAALLVSMHGTALYERWPPEDPGERRKVEAFVDEQHAFQRKLGSGLAADQVRRNQKLIFAWDYISLALCLDWAPTQVKDVPTANEPITLDLSDDTLEPWPFRADRVALKVEARSLPKRYDDERELHAALADAQPHTIQFELRARG